jgi:hypothetical protein
MENRLREFGYGGRKRSQVLKGQQPLSSNDANTIIDINLGVNVLGVC